MERTKVEELTPWAAQLMEAVEDRGRTGVVSKLGPADVHVPRLLHFAGKVPCHCITPWPQPRLTLRPSPAVFGEGDDV